MRRPVVRISVRLTVVLVALGLGGWVRVADRLPDDWDAKEFEAGVERAIEHDGQSVEADVLAWVTEEDDRPLRYDSALAWARVESRGEVRWALLLVYRHPLDDPQWHVAWITHTPLPIRGFERPPDNTEIYKFVDEANMGKFFKTGQNGFRTLNSRVRRPTWYRRVGEMPTRFFP